MTNEDYGTIYHLEQAAEAWKRAGNAFQQIGNDSMRVLCREKEAEIALNLARIRTSLIPALALDSPPLWRAKISQTALHRAYYSPTAADLYGSSIYSTADGSEVEVTCVEPGLEDTGIYNWKDAVVVGPVSSYIRTGRKGVAD